ncbi:hypothetical protein AVEN_95196-1 [Araneus ventricosus]|uniref:Uncharacterized protein n=1 Tax=Araneus ventricosus TaxID=182803 RepID=A0A4Y2J8Z0_ARAVE|nr:hypothetical protein AVEN_95196-1 [Araneus ventricosus]
MLGNTGIAAFCRRPGSWPTFALTYTLCHPPLLFLDTFNFEAKCPSYSVGSHDSPSGLFSSSFAEDGASLVGGKKKGLRMALGHLVEVPIWGCFGRTQGCHSFRFPGEVLGIMRIVRGWEWMDDCAGNICFTPKKEWVWASINEGRLLGSIQIKS